MVKLSEMSNKELGAKLADAFLEVRCLQQEIVDLENANLKLRMSYKEGEDISVVRARMAGWLEGWKSAIEKLLNSNLVTQEAADAWYEGGGRAAAELAAMAGEQEATS